jgi:hypothetical protein
MAENRNIRETTMAEHIAAAQGKATVTDEEIKQTIDALRAKAAERPETDGSRAAARSVRFYDIYINNPGTTVDENWTEFEATIAQGGSGGDLPVTEETKEAKERRELEARLNTASIGQGQSYLLGQGLLRVNAVPEGPQFKEQAAPESDEPSEMQAKISGKPMPDKARPKEEDTQARQGVRTTADQRREQTPERPVANPNPNLNPNLARPATPTPPAPPKPGAPRWPLKGRSGKTRCEITSQRCWELSVDKLLEADTALIATGLQPGLNPQSVPLWADSRNVHFTGFGARSARGFSVPQAETIFFDSVAGLFDASAGLFDDGGGITGPLVVPSTSAIRGLLAYRLASGLGRLVFTTIDKIWKWDGGLSADEVQSGLSGINDEQETIGNDATFTSIVSWGDWFITTNNIDPIKVYKTGAAMASLGGSPPSRAKILAKLGPHVLAFNTVNGANWVEWCAEDNAEQWVTASDPTAGNLPVRDLENPIASVAKIGEALGIFTKNEMQLMQYLGGVFQFGSKPQMEGLGALSLTSTISIGPKIFGLYYDDIFVTDGFSRQSIAEKPFGRWIQKHVNFDQKSKIAGWHETNLNTVKWSVPIDGSKVPNFIIGFNYATGAFSFHDQAISYGIDPGAFKYSTVGTPNGKIFWTESSDVIEFDGGPINAWVETKPISIDAPQAWKVLQYLKFVLKDLASADVKFKIGWQEKLTDSVTWSSEYTLADLNHEEFFENFGFVFVTLKIYSNSNAAQWTLEGLEAHGVGVGRRF